MPQYHLGFLTYTLSLIAIFCTTLFPSTPYFLIYIPLTLAFASIAIDAIKNILARKISTELFLVCATIIALLAQQTHEITIVLLIMLVAKYFEELIESRTDQAIESLVKLVPTHVRIVINNDEKIVPRDTIQPTMLINVKTGEQIPVDGIITQGQAQINEASLTGESTAHHKQISDPVFAGTFLENGAITIRVQKVGSDTLFGKIERLLHEAETSKARMVTIANTAALIIMPTLLVFIILVWLITGNLTMVSTLLIFGSPIELTLITPMAVIAGTAAAFRYGILIKGGLALERFHAIDTLIFDKTGTLTIGKPTISSLQPADSTTSEVELLRLAAIVEKGSSHILAQAIAEEAHVRNLNIPNPETYEAVTGHGVIATYNDERFMLGSKHFIQAPEHGNTQLPVSLLTNEHAHATIFYLISDKKVYGKICMTDNVRPDAAHTLQALKKHGIKNIMLLSGDKEETAQHIAKKLGIEKAFGEVTPDQKLTIIRTLQQQGHRIGMVGDGINDAPALKQADVGIALGAMGMEPAIQAADIVLMANDLHGVVFTRALSQKIMVIIKQNIFIGFAFIHLVGIVLTLAGFATPIQAALFHAISDLLIMINSARLIHFKLKS